MGKMREVVTDEDFLRNVKEYAKGISIKEACELGTLYLEAKFKGNEVFYRDMAFYNTLARAVGFVGDSEIEKRWPHLNVFVPTDPHIADKAMHVLTKYAVGESKTVLETLKELEQKLQPESRLAVELARRHRPH